MNELAMILDEEIKLNKKEPWNKLDKTMKLKRLNEYADTFCKKVDIHDEVKIKKLKEFLKQKLNQRRFNTNKDVNYDTEKMVITNIPNLVYEDNIFILGRNDNRHSTVKCLTPTKKN
jgi:hypothetical protein